MGQSQSRFVSQSAVLDICNGTWILDTNLADSVTTILDRFKDAGFEAVEVVALLAS
jgi:hypothetical protein